MDYSIGGHRIRITYYGTETELDAILPSFLPFKVKGETEGLLMHLEVVTTLREVPQEERRLIRDVDTGNGMTRVDRLKDGGYQFLVRDLYGRPCALLITTATFDNCQCAIRGDIATRRFALNNALMLAYAFSAAYHGTLLIHASVVRHEGRAYAFTAKSGTGKSTQVANWMRHIDGCDIMNDDNPIIRINDGVPTLYGSPWSGKTPCYRNTQAPLGAVVLIERAMRNYVTDMKPINAFAILLTACSAMKWDEELYQRMCETVTQFVEKVKIVTLNCLPDRESAEVCRDYLER